MATIRNFRLHRPASQRGKQPYHPLSQRPRAAKRPRPGLLVRAGNRQHRRSADGRPRDDAVRQGPQPGLPDRHRAGHCRLARRRSATAGRTRRLQHRPENRQNAWRADRDDTRRGIAGIANQAARNIWGRRRCADCSMPASRPCASGCRRWLPPIRRWRTSASPPSRYGSPTSLRQASSIARLQTPTFEALQQKADQATFERRALAVEKERAIAENELANQTSWRGARSCLIAEEAENARNRATGVAEAQQVEAAAEAERIRAVEGARAEAERQRIAIYRDLPPASAARPRRPRARRQAGEDRACQRRRPTCSPPCSANSARARHSSMPR